MTSVVLIHIGEQLPDYFYLCCEQVRRNFPGNIHVVIPRKHVCDNAHKRIGMHPVAYESLVGHHIYQEFTQNCFLNGFWNVTMGRIYLLEVLMRKKKLKDVIHIENDVLLYHNPNDLIDEFHFLCRDRILLTPIGNSYASAAYVFVKNCNVIGKLNKTMLGLMKQGKQVICRKLGTQDPNEMMLLAHIWKNYDNIIEYFPIQPEGKGSQNLEVFGGVFDPASYGQFLGGTQSDGPGWYGKDHHWIGKSLHQNKYSFEWCEKNGIKKPILICRKRKYRIFNLHCHSKKLNEFM